MKVRDLVKKTQERKKLSTQTATGTGSATLGFSVVTTEDRIVELEAKIVRLQGAKRVKDYFHSEERLVEFFSLEILDLYGSMSLAEFVELLRANAYETNPAAKLGYINALADVIGLPYGADNVWAMPGPDWEPRTA